jgi:hypothetical protein
MATPAAQTAETPAAPDPKDASAIGRLGAQKQKFKAAWKKSQAELEQLRTEVADLKKGGGPDKIKELEGKLREVKHRAKFDELAKAAGVKPKALDDLWEKSGYKAEGDAPDEAAITAAIDKQRAERDYLFDAPAEGGQQGQEQGQGQQQQQQQQHGYDPFNPAPKPGPGRGQGGQKQANPGAFQATQEQIRDPAWCFANAAKLQQVAKEVGGMTVREIPNKFAIV